MNFKSPLPVVLQRRRLISTLRRTSRRLRTLMHEQSVAENYWMIASQFTLSHIYTQYTSDCWLPGRQSAPFTHMLAPRTYVGGRWNAKWRVCITASGFTSCTTHDLTSRSTTAFAWPLGQLTTSSNTSSAIVEKTRVAAYNTGSVQIRCKSTKVRLRVPNRSASFGSSGIK